jgi:DNA-binding transcriptional ArsR family regulator
VKLKPEERLAALDAVCNALAHPARRQILLTMKFRGGSMTAGEIDGRFGHAWPTTTRHLRVLEAAGLVSARKQGRTRVYQLEMMRLEIINDWLRWFETKAPAQ